MAASAISLQASDHPIKSVTIFHSAAGTAEITRTFPVSLKSGKNAVNICGISSCIDTDSARIRVLSGPTHVRICDICCKTEQVFGRRDALVAERTLRQQEYDRLVDTVARLHVSNAHAHTSSLVQNVLEVTVKNSAVTTPGPQGPKAGRDVDELLQTLVQRMHSASNALHTLDRQILELERELSVPVESRKGDGSTVITTTIHAEEECSVVLQLTYLVAGARWEPQYDLHTHTSSSGRPSPEVSLLQYAKITQFTGEDWKDTEITLSASRSQRLGGISIPTLNAVRASPKQATPTQPRPTLTRTKSSIHMQPLARGHPLVLPPGGGLFHLQAAVSPKPEAGTASHNSPDTLLAAPDDSAYVHVAPQEPRTNAMAPAAPATQTRSEPVLQDNMIHSASLAPAHVHDSSHSASAPGSLVYRVGEGEQVSLPSDGLAHTVPIATLPLRAELEYVCVPRESNAVFLQARIVNASERDLLAGPVWVFVDDIFVAKTELKHTGVNESFECILGIDTGIKVSFQQQSHVNTVHDTTDTTQTAYAATITVTNGHDVDIPRLVIRDVVPVGDEDKKITVSLNKPVGLAQASLGENVDVSLDAKAGLVGVKVRWTKNEAGRGGREDGMYEWICDIRAGARLGLEAEWVVTGPRDIASEEAQATKTNYRQ